MAVLFLFAMVTPAGSVGIDLDETIHTGGMNELNVRQAARDYMDTRAAYLLGETETMEWLIHGISNDEADHKDLLMEKNLVLINLEYNITSVECYDTESYATIHEVVTYSINGDTATELVTHELTVIHNDSITFVVSDRYMELFSGFESCAYVPPMDEYSTHSTTNSGGSEYCIIDIALKEVGTPETGDNMTEYGDWYGNNGYPWCATFIAWCAYKANIPQSVIPRQGACSKMKEFYEGLNLYRDISENPTPEPGDIFFKLSSNQYHVGIVQYVEGDFVWIIHGNASDMVKRSTMSKSDPALIGYAKPNYTNSGHSAATHVDEGNTHSGTCMNCGSDFVETHEYQNQYLNSTTHRAACIDCMHLGSTTSHFYFENYDDTNHWEECLDCGHKKNESVHTSSGYLNNILSHWRECTDCGSAYDMEEHIFLTHIDGSQRCTVCNYTVAGSGGITPVPGLSKKEDVLES